MTKIEIVREDEKATHILKAIRLIDDGVEIAPVVRCKDCKHRGTDYCIFHIKGEPADEELLKKLDNDFCSYGERKDNGICKKS